MSGIALQPVFDHVVIKLLGPQHAGEGLAHHVPCVRGKILRDHGGIEFIRFTLTLREYVVETDKRILAGKVGVGQPQANGHGFTRSDYE